MKIFTIVLFAVMVVAQWFVPMSMVYETEDTRIHGKRFRFETQPIDPTDPFRGKYITLNYTLSTYETNTTGWEDEMDVYVTVASDTNEIARMVEVSHTPPENTTSYFKAKVDGHNANTLFISFPFERFYLEESKAADAETLYNDNNRDENRKPAYAEVYILSGKTYLTDVKIDGESVVDIVKRRQGK